MTYYRIIFVDGQFNAQLSHIESLPHGVVLTNMLNAKNQHADIITNFAIDSEDDGIFFFIPENIELEIPIYISFITTEQPSHKNVNFFNLIIVQANSKVSFFEEYIGEHASQITNNINTKIYAEKNTTINHCKLQRENNLTTHLATYNISLQQNSSLQASYVALGGKLARDNVQISLAAEKASYNSNGIYLLSDLQNIEYNTHIEHQASAGTSNILFKGIINDQATATFNGRVLIKKDTQNNETHLTNKNLLLSETAKINTAPELEIYADNVICTHGATVGQLDQQAIFYLRARGLSEEEAKKLLIKAFIQEVIEQIFKPFKQNIEDAVKSYEL